MKLTFFQCMPALWLNFVASVFFAAPRQSWTKGPAVGCPAAFFRTNHPPACQNARINRENTVTRSGKLALLDEPINVRHDVRQLFGPNRPFIVLPLVTIGLDAISTIAFMSVVGPGAEQNPVVRQLSYAFGIFAGPPLGKLFQLFAAVALTIIAPRLTRLVLAVVILMNLFAFVINMHVFFLS
jgi:hypothetical protein